MHNRTYNRVELTKGKGTYKGTIRHLIVGYQFSTKVVINKWTKNKKKESLNGSSLTQQFKRSN